MSKQRDLERQKKNLVQLSYKASGTVRTIAGIFSSLFVLKIIFDFTSRFNPTPTGLWNFAQITIVLYFWSWFLAALKGIQIQSLVLNSTNDSDKLPRSGYFGLLVGVPIGASAMALVLYRDRINHIIAIFWSGSIVELLIFLLAAFWLWDILWHWTVRKTIRNMIETSKSNLIGPAKKYFEHEQLVLFEIFIFGRWRIWRILFGIIIIGFILFVILQSDSSINIPYTTQVISKDSLLAIVTFGFVLISEMWIWVVRHRLLVGVNTIESLGRRYNLSIKPTIEHSDE